MLRQYQETAIIKLRKCLTDGFKRPIMALPTGGGKSIIFGQIISNIIQNGKIVLWLVHRRNLVNQMRDVLREHFDIEPGVIMSGVETEPEKQVYLCTIQTYSRRLNLGYFADNKFYVDADVVLIDEGHRSVAKSYQDIIAHYHDKIIMACSATPMRADGRGMGEVYDSIVDIAGVKELTDQGYLAPARYFAPVNVDLSDVKVERGDYLIKDLDGKINKTKLIGDIVDNWLRLSENRKTIVYAVNVKHSIAICEAFNNAGVKAEHLDARSSDKERDDVFKKMQNGEITVICNVALYQEGLDVPDVSCIVMARPTKSMGLWRQCAGRGLRPTKEAKDCLILDHGNVIEEHGLLDWPIEWSLDGKKRAWSKPSKKVVEKLVKCRACHKVFSGAKICPDCGTPVKSFGKKILTVEAELEELGKKEKHSMAEKRQWFGMFLYHCRQKGYNEGWISHKFKEKFKVWPKGLKNTAPIEPNQEFKNWVRHLNIKYAKRKAKEKAQESLHRGGELAEQHRFQSDQV